MYLLWTTAPALISLIRMGLVDLHCKDKKAVIFALLFPVQGSQTAKTSAEDFQESMEWHSDLLYLTLTPYLQNYISSLETENKTTRDKKHS